jgi:hypothetical protein
VVLHQNTLGPLGVNQLIQTFIELCDMDSKEGEDYRYMSVMD